jgi:peptide-methionine (R)-S-oxide reductase
MNRRNWIFRISGLMAASALPFGTAGAAAPFPLTKTRDEWRKLLPPDAYHVLFEEGTERAGSSPLNAEKQDGTFICAACAQPLFDSAHKYDSGTGWPSFWQPIAGALGTTTDFKLIYPRTEYHCSRCGGHQGHVFNDGPKPTGKRYCNNGVALAIVVRGAPLPALRT